MSRTSYSESSFFRVVATCFSYHVEHFCVIVSVASILTGSGIEMTPSFIETWVVKIVTVLAMTILGDGRSSKQVGVAMMKGRLLNHFRTHM